MSFKVDAEMDVMYVYFSRENLSNNPLIDSN